MPHRRCVKEAALWASAYVTCMPNGWAQAEDGCRGSQCVGGGGEGAGHRWLERPRSHSGWTGREETGLLRGEPRAGDRLEVPGTYTLGSQCHLQQPQDGSSDSSLWLRTTPATTQYFKALHPRPQRGLPFSTK